MSIKHDIAILSLALDAEKGHFVGCTKRANIALSLTNEQAKQSLRTVHARLRETKPDATLDDAKLELARGLRTCGDLKEFIEKVGI